VGSARSVSVPASKTPAKRGANGKSAFTLIEILVVTVVIVLMLGMAVPVFRVITGSRSEAGATNVIAAMVNRARTDAIGLQQPYGVAFFYDTAKQQSYMAEVYFPPIQATATPAANTYGYYTQATYSYPFYKYGGTQVGGPPLDMVPDTDTVPLPAGVCVQTVCNCNYSGTYTRSSDGYLSVGVILFDGKGRIISQNYGIAATSPLGRAMGGLSYPSTSANIGTTNSSGTITQLGVPSQFGLVVFQRDAWLNQRPNLGTGYSDALYMDNTANQLSDYNNTTNGPSPAQEETWLDQNATPLLIDRYTGTLIKAE
jgi:type II secretory pathway pseudopilin PulG